MTTNEHKYLCHKESGKENKQIIHEKIVAIHDHSRSVADSQSDTVIRVASQTEKHSIP